MPTIDAIYSGGKFQPLTPVALQENEHVRLQVLPPAVPEMSDEEFDRRVSECKSIAELNAFLNSLPPDDDDKPIDMLGWMNETRREQGCTRLFNERP